MKKTIHIKPSIYAYFFYELKEIALKYGYNLVLHGSLNRDLDLIAIPWEQEVLPREEMVEEFANYLGGYIMLQDGFKSKGTYHGRQIYVININRMLDKEGNDKQYYLDISIMPSWGLK